MTGRRGRDGDLIEAHELTGDEHDCGTQNLVGAARGFLGEDSEGRPRYCYVCRPTLHPRNRVRNRGFALTDR